MKLSEIEMDLPYVKNKLFIKTRQETEGIKYEEATKQDYEENWKQMRREFQLTTRCMTSMVERLMSPIDNNICWKIIFNCFEKCEEKNCANLLGVYNVPIEFDINDFLKLDDYQKKKNVIMKIIEGINIISSNAPIDVSGIYAACKSIIECDYYNEWIWGRRISLGEFYSQIKIQHETTSLNIFLQLLDSNHILIDEKLLINTVPDERVYDQYLGSLKKISDKKVALITKKGEKILYTF